MKQIKPLKALAGLFHKISERLSAKAALATDDSNLAEERQLRQALLSIREESSGHTEYRHWGLNE